MRISTRGRYALRLMLDLALSDPDEYVTIRSISERQEISYKYLEQIISGLNRGGLVKSIRGSQEGIGWRACRKNTLWDDFETDRRKPCSRGMYGRRTEPLPRAISVLPRRLEAA